MEPSSHQEVHHAVERRLAGKTVELGLGSRPIRDGATLAAEARGCCMPPGRQADFVAHLRMSSTSPIPTCPRVSVVCFERVPPSVTDPWPCQRPRDCPRREDYEYVRGGTRNLFHAGWPTWSYHLRQRTMQDFALQIRWLVSTKPTQAVPVRRRVELDHPDRTASCYEAFPPNWRLGASTQRLEFHYAQARELAEYGGRWSSRRRACPRGRNPDQDSLECQRVRVATGIPSTSLAIYHQKGQNQTPQATGPDTELNTTWLVVISCGAEVIARHPRSYERDDFVFDPIHYLPLLEQKTAALDQAAPLQGWDLPEEFATLRRLLEARMGRRGKREFVQVLRLMETFSHQEVHHAVQDALRLGAISFDAVKHLLLCRLEGRPPRLDLDLYPYLPRVTVKTTSVTDYMALLPGRAA